MANFRVRAYSLTLTSLLLWASMGPMTLKIAHSATGAMPDGSLLSVHISTIALNTNGNWDLTGTASFVKNSNDTSSRATELVYTLNNGTEILLTPDNFALPWKNSVEDSWRISNLQASAGGAAEGWDPCRTDDPHRQSKETLGQRFRLRRNVENPEGYPRRTDLRKPAEG